MVNHLDKHNLIRDSQHGFRQGYSCTTNLLTFLENVTAKINHRVDKVPHQRLIFKLKAHGVDGLVVNWITAGYPTDGSVSVGKNMLHL